VNKVAVFALDGATFAVIRPAVEQGELPHLGALLEKGASGELESTIPPITGAAWTTFQTGVNPGRHGAFDWLTREEGSYRLRPISSQMLRQPRLWDFIGQQGGRVCVLGVPVTYPPRAVNGCLISGILTPEGADYTYPPELGRELEARVGKFPFQPEHWRGRSRAREWLAELKRTIEARKKIAQYLLRRTDWDFFMLHLMELDSVQHQMWHLRDGVTRPRYRVSVEGDPILEIYRAADLALGELMAELPRGTTVFVISDHGFGPLHWNIYLNTWLLEEGYLVLKRGLRTGLKRAAFRLGLTQERLFPWAERLRLLERGAQLRHGQLHDLLGRFFLSLEDVDWQRTRAYSYGNIGQIYLNRRGREPEGVVQEAEAEELIEELLGKLRKLANPYTGEPVIERLYRKEELYSGESLAQAAEILLLPRRGCMILGTTDFAAARVVAPTFAGSGWHELLGVLIAAGEGLARGQVEGARLLDMCPTILYAMGLRIPRGLDGRVLEELFREDYRRSQPLEWFAEEVELALEVEEEGEGWEEEARRRLQDLGYI
jgi:predicted AlkP superfamily phosphohydrolase/phosphomutase